MNWDGKIKAGHHIEHTFTCDETPYFHFTDAFNIPCERAMDAIHVYQEFKNRTDDLFLKALHAAIKNTLRKNPINIFEVNKLNDQLGERLDMALPPSRIIENMASIYYFDESENPYKFDRAYAEKKIKNWKLGKITDPTGKEESMDFFLLMPIKDLIPSFDSYNLEIPDYLKIADMMDWVHLQTVFENLSSDQQKKISSMLPYYTSISEKMKGSVLESI